MTEKNKTTVQIDESKMLSLNNVNISGRIESSSCDEGLPIMVGKEGGWGIVLPNKRSSMSSSDG